MTEQRSIKELVARLQIVLAEIEWPDRPFPPELRPPAPEAEIAALEEAWGRELPPSYKEFLEVANGMHGLEQFDWGIAGASPPDQFQTFDDVREGMRYAYEQRDPEHPALDEIREVALAGTDFDRQIVYFVPGTLDREEPPLRRLDFDEGFETHPLFPDFRAFVAFVVQAYEQQLEMQQAAPDQGGEELSDEDRQLLETISSMLAPEPEPEPEPEPTRLSPEVQLAAKLCQVTLQKLMDAELIELNVGPSVREDLEGYMLKKLMRSNSPEDTMDAWIYALSKAREVHELWGTDEELKALMAEAFEEIYAQKQS